jgi:hypothetical protein
MYGCLSARSRVRCLCRPGKTQHLLPKSVFDRPGSDRRWNLASTTFPDAEPMVRIRFPPAGGEPPPDCGMAPERRLSTRFAAKNPPVLRRERSRNAPIWHQSGSLPCRAALTDQAARAPSSRGGMGVFLGLSGAPTTSRIRKRGSAPSRARPQRRENGLSLPRLYQARFIVLDVADARAHRPASQLFRLAGRERGSKLRLIL